MRRLYGGAAQASAGLAPPLAAASLSTTSGFASLKPRPENSGAIQVKIARWLHNQIATAAAPGCQSEFRKPVSGQRNAPPPPAAGREHSFGAVATGSRRLADDFPQNREFFAIQQGIRETPFGPAADWRVAFATRCSSRRIYGFMVRSSRRADDNSRIAKQTEGASRLRQRRPVDSKAGVEWRVLHDLPPTQKTHRNRGGESLFPRCGAGLGPRLVGEYQ
jgi:hypothetical protein